MKTYTCTFNGRPNFAIGLRFEHTETVQAESAESAILKLYENYEHIQMVNMVDTETGKQVFI